MEINKYSSIFDLIPVARYTVSNRSLFYFREKKDHTASSNFTEWDDFNK